MSKNSDGVLAKLITFSHETLGLSPNQISMLGLVVGVVEIGRAHV